MTTPSASPSDHRHPRIIALVRQGETLPHPASASRPVPSRQEDDPTPFALQQAEQLQRHRRDVVEQVLLRHVVEPAAISLAAASPGLDTPWFIAYPRALRNQLASRLATVLELEINSSGELCQRG